MLDESLSQDTDPFAKYDKPAPAKPVAKPRTATPAPATGFDALDYHKREIEGAGYVVTATTNGKHAAGSPHYNRKGLDVRTKDLDGASGDKLISDMESRYPGLKYIDERDRANWSPNTTEEHLHFDISGVDSAAYKKPKPPSDPFTKYDAPAQVASPPAANEEERAAQQNKILGIPPPVANGAANPRAQPKPLTQSPTFDFRRKPGQRFDFSNYTPQQAAKMQVNAPVDRVTAKATELLRPRPGGQGVVARQPDGSMVTPTAPPSPPGLVERAARKLLEISPVGITARAMGKDYAGTIIEGAKDVGQQAEEFAALPSDWWNSLSNLAKGLDKASVALPQAAVSLLDTIGMAAAPTGGLQLMGVKVPGVDPPLAELLQDWTQRQSAAIDKEYFEAHGIDPRVKTKSSVLGGAAGGSVPLLAGGAVGLGVKGVAAIGAAINAQQAYAEARAKKAPPEDARRAAFFATPIGALEGVGGVEAKLARVGVSRVLAQKFGEVVKTAGADLGQELTTQVLNNLNAAVLAGYDKDRRALDGIVETAMGSLGMSGAMGGAGMVGRGAGKMADAQTRAAAADTQVLQQAINETFNGQPQPSAEIVSIAGLKQAQEAAQLAESEGQQQEQRHPLLPSYRVAKAIGLGQLQQHLAAGLSKRAEGQARQEAQQAQETPADPATGFRVDPKTGNFIDLDAKKTKAEQGVAAKAVKAEEAVVYAEKTNQALNAARQGSDKDAFIAAKARHLTALRANQATESTPEKRGDLEAEIALLEKEKLGANKGAPSPPTTVASSAPTPPKAEQQATNDPFTRFSKLAQAEDAGEAVDRAEMGRLATGLVKQYGVAMPTLYDAALKGEKPAAPSTNVPELDALIAARKASQNIPQPTPDERPLATTAPDTRPQPEPPVATTPQKPSEMDAARDLLGSNTMSARKETEGKIANVKSRLAENEATIARLKDKPNRGRIEEDMYQQAVHNEVDRSLLAQFEKELAAMPPVATTPPAGVELGNEQTNYPVTPATARPDTLDSLPSQPARGNTAPTTRQTGTESSLDSSAPAEAPARSEQPKGVTDDIRRPTESTDTTVVAPASPRQADATETAAPLTPEQLAKRTAAQAKMSEREALHTPETKGAHGKTASLMAKSLPDLNASVKEGQERPRSAPVLDHPGWQKELDFITPDAEHQDILNAIADELVSDPKVHRASQMESKHWTEVADKLGQQPDLRAAVANAVVHGDDFQKRVTQMNENATLVDLLHQYADTGAGDSRAAKIVLGKLQAELKNAKLNTGDDALDIKKGFLQNAAKAIIKRRNEGSVDRGVRTDIDTAPSDQQQPPNARHRETEGTFAAESATDTASTPTRASGTEQPAAEPKPIGAEQGDQQGVTPAARRANMLRTEYGVTPNDPRFAQGRGIPGARADQYRVIQQANLAEVLPPDTVVVYHDTSLSNAKSLLPRLLQANGGRELWVSPSLDLAAGQKGSGVKLVLHPEFANGVAPKNLKNEILQGTGQQAGEYKIDKTVKGIVQGVIVNGRTFKALQKSELAKVFDFAQAQEVEGELFVPVNASYLQAPIRVPPPRVTAERKPASDEPPPAEQQGVKGVLSKAISALDTAMNKVLPPEDTALDRGLTQVGDVIKRAGESVKKIYDSQHDLPNDYWWLKEEDRPAYRRAQAAKEAATTHQNALYHPPEAPLDRATGQQERSVSVLLGDIGKRDKPPLTDGERAAVEKRLAGNANETAKEKSPRRLASLKEDRTQLESLLGEPGEKDTVGEPAAIEVGDKITYQRGGREYTDVVDIIHKTGEYQVDNFGTKFIAPGEVLGTQKSDRNIAKAERAKATQAQTDRALEQNAARMAKQSPLIEQIVTAAQQPMPDIVPVIETKGSDGKWYGFGGAPGGVNLTSERRNAGYVFADKNGSRYGNREATEEALRDRYTTTQQRQDAILRQDLLAKTPEELQASADYWIDRQTRKENAAATAKEITTKEKKKDVLGTGSAENDAKLASLRERKKTGRGMTAADEAALALYEAQVKADPAKWEKGQGTGWRVYSGGKVAQINRGFRVVEINAEKKLAKVEQVQDTGLTTSGGNADKIGTEWVHIADLVREKKYDAPKSGITLGAVPEKPGTTLSSNFGGAFKSFNEADIGKMATHFVAHAKDYVAWGKAMIREFGQSVRPRLTALWEGIKAFTKDETGALDVDRVKELIKGAGKKVGFESNAEYETRTAFSKMGIVEVREIRGGREVTGSIYPVKIVHSKQFEVKLLPGGEVEVHTDSWGGERLMRDKIARYLNDFRSDAGLPERQYFRYTNNKDETHLADKGQLRASRNHRDGYDEAGISVSRDPGYGQNILQWGDSKPYKYGYIISGQEVQGRVGADREVLLDPKTVKVITTIQPASKLYEKGRQLAAAEHERKLAEIGGWTPESFRELEKKFEPVGNTLYEKYKSAFNRGTFDPADANISHDVGSAVYAAAKGLKKVAAWSFNTEPRTATPRAKRVAFPSGFKFETYNNAINEVLKKSQPTPAVKAELMKLLAEQRRAIVEGDFGRFLGANKDIQDTLRTKTQGVIGLANTLTRALSLSGEVSFVARQGASAAIANTKAWAKALPEFRVIGSAQAYFNGVARILARPLIANGVAAKAGLDIPIVSEFRANSDVLGREENTLSGVSEHIPVLSQLERGNKVFIDALRTNMFEQYYKEIVGDDVTTWKKLTSLQQKGLQRMAKEVNIAGRRGDIPEQLQAVANAAGFIFTSPRNAIAIAQEIDPTRFIRAWMDNPRAGKAVLKRYARVAGAVATAAGLAYAFGATVNLTDPEDADFGKMKWGNKRFDLFPGGMGTMVKLSLRLGKNAAEILSAATFPTEQSLARRAVLRAKGQSTRGLSPDAQAQIDAALARSKAQLGTFLRYKESPLVSLVHDQGFNRTTLEDETGRKVSVGQSAIGEKKFLLESLKDRSWPLFWQQVVENYDAEGASGAVAALPELFGHGAQLYQSSRVPAESATTRKGLLVRGAGIRQGRIANESQKDFQARVTDVNAWLAEYEPRLKANKEFQKQTAADQQKLLEKLERAAVELSKKNKPDVSKLMGEAIFDGFVPAAEQMKEKQGKSQENRPFFRLQPQQ